MLFIISFHYALKAGWDYSNASLINKITADYFIMLGEVGVNCFILISGYFLIKGSFSKKKLLLLLLEVQFYNYLSLFMVSHCKLDVFLSSLTISNVFPTLFGVYWFATAYILLYIFSPYLTKSFFALSKKDVRKLIVTLFLIFSLIPSFMGLTKGASFGFLGYSEGFLNYNRFIWMVTLFFIASYIRIYDSDKPFLFPARFYFMLTFLLLIILGLFFLLTELHPNLLSPFGINSAQIFWPPNSLITLALSLSLFMGFQKLKIGSISLVNIMASTTFGIYLLHDGHLKTVLWNNIFNTNTMIGRDDLAIQIIIATLSIFVFGACFDLMRQQAEKIVLRLCAFLEARNERL